jgi:hypothetical protein
MIAELYGVCIIPTTELIRDSWKTKCAASIRDGAIFNSLIKVGPITSPIIRITNPKAMWIAIDAVKVLLRTVSSPFPKAIVMNLEVP